MAYNPATWAMLQSMQSTIATQVKIGGTSPFSTLSTAPNPNNPGGVSDATRYGTNPNGNVTVAVYIGVPKDWDSLYPVQCHVIPSRERTYRHTLGQGIPSGAKLWLEQSVLLRVHVKAMDDYLAAMQTAVNIGDQMHAVIGAHVEDANALTVAAAREDPSAGSSGYVYSDEIGLEWLTWQGTWWRRQEFTIQGGFVP